MVIKFNATVVLNGLILYLFIFPKLLNFRNFWTQTVFSLDINPGSILTQKGHPNISHIWLALGGNQNIWFA